MATAATKILFTPRTYLDLERDADQKHEYRDGEIVAMAGSSFAHNSIAINLVRVISTQLLGRPCRVHASDIRVCVDPDRLYIYPDVVAFFGEPETLDDETSTLRNPSTIIEVLSPSTEAYDRGEKFAAYGRVRSLREYVLIAQDRMRVELHVRDREHWLQTELNQPDQVLRLDSTGCEVSLREVYAGIELTWASSIVARKSLSITGWNRSAKTCSSRTIG